MAINIDYLHAHNHRDGSVSDQTNTSFNYKRSSGSHWHGAECNITGLTPGKEYKAKFRVNTVNNNLLLALVGTTITTYTFDTTGSQEVGYFTSTELETTFTPVGTTITALIIQHEGTPYYSFTFSNWEVTANNNLKTNLLEIQSELNNDLDIVNSITNHKEILPYKQLEYIQSTGTQHIDTEFYPNGNTRVQCKWMNGSSNGVVFGAYNGNWTTGFGFYAAEVNSQGTYFRHYFSNDNTKLTKTIIMETDMNKGSLVINGTSYFTTDTKSFTLNYPMYIFCGNWTGRLEQPVSTQLCYFKIWDNDVLVRDFIPVRRKSDNIICLYDKVTQEFFTNAGTGEFIAGPEVIE